MLREAAFIERNKAKWQRLEMVLSGLDGLSGDEVSDLYVQLNDDLSYAQTFYPQGRLPEYLNGLAVRLHQHIYRNKRTPRGRFRTFWRTEVPLAMAAVRTPLLVSFTVFALAALLGAVSAKHDPTFIRLIMGDAYVDMTLENIRAGKPMGVYATTDPATMFLGITFNNVRVSFLAFALGMFLSVGTGVLLFLNGVMLGAFQWFCHEQGILHESLLSIWAHGTLEISAIIIAGAAGIALGNGFLFPGTYRRIESFRHGARLGVKVVVGLVPVFILAGFIESFLTRHMLTFPAWVSLTLISGSLAFVVWYYLILPSRVQRRLQPASPEA